MNIVQLHFKSKFYLDSERSPRFEASQTDKALNSGITDIVLDRYHNIREQQRKYAFQTSQRLRDELYTLVLKKESMTATDDLIPVAQFPDDYMLTLIVIANISGQQIHTIPITYDEMSVIELDPFSRPSITWPERIYRIESAEGIKIIFGSIGRLLNAIMYYIKKPATVSLGTEVNDTTTIMLAPKPVIAYVDSVLLMHRPGTTFTHELKQGEKLTLGTVNGETYATLVSGIVYIDFTECDLPEILHEEICRKAAAILSGNVENYNREKSLEENQKNTQ